MTTLKIAAAVAVLLSITGNADARRSAIDANGNFAGACMVKSGKTGATARVGCSHVSKFQSYIDDLEAGGASIRFMGGIRRGKCWSGGMHPCGRALDVCQTGRGRVDSRCRLPGRSAIAAIAARHGLFEGGQWCHSDYGHAQVGVSAGACGSSTYASARSRHHRHATVATEHVQSYEFRSFTNY